MLVMIKAKKVISVTMVDSHVIELPIQDLVDFEKAIVDLYRAHKSGNLTIILDKIIYYEVIDVDDKDEE